MEAVTQGGPKRGPLPSCQSTGPVSHQLSNKENGKARELLPRYSPQPKTELCARPRPGENPAELQPAVAQESSQRGGWGQTPQHCSAGEGSGGGRRGLQRRARRSAGKHNELLLTNSCLARCSHWGVCADRRGHLPSKPTAPA